jgi:putative transposase
MLTAHYHNTGTGHLVQGRFKSFPIQEDDHFYAVCRCVERNALSAGVVGDRAEDWVRGSLSRRVFGAICGDDILSPWPLPCPDDWAARVNEPQSEGELQAIRRSVKRGCPFGAEAGVEATSNRLHWGQTVGPQGYPPGPRTTGEAPDVEPSPFG